MSKGHGGKGKRKVEMSDLFSAMLGEVIPEAHDVSNVERNTPLPNNRFTVFFDPSGNQLSFPDVRKKVAGFLEDKLMRPPTKQELEIGFNTWRSFMRCNDSGLDGKTVKLSRGRRVVLRSSKNQARPNMEEVEMAVLSAVARLGDSKEEIQRKKWNQKEYTCRDCGEKITFTVARRFNGSCPLCSCKNLELAMADADNDQDAILYLEVREGMNLLFGRKHCV